MKQLQHARIVTRYDEAYEAQYIDPSMPRNAIASERLALGAMLWHGPSVGARLIADDFYSVWHADLFSLVHELYEAHPGYSYLDPIAVKDYMLLKKGLHSRFSTDMVFMYDEAISYCLGAHACGYHVELVLLAAASRLTQQYGQALAQHADADSVEEVRERFQPALDSIRSRAAADTEGLEQSRLDEQVRQARLRFSTGMSPALSTGLTDLDNVLNGGFRNGTINVVGARPGVGKSLLASSVAVHVARMRSHRVLYVTMELTADEVTNRMLADVGRIDLTHLQNPEQLTDQDYNRLGWAEEEVADWPLHIEEGGKSIAQVEQVARDYLAPVASGLLIVDFLQRIQEDGKQQSRERHVGMCASRLTDLAKELHVPLMCIVSFSRESVRRGGEPRMDDIRDSGGVESDADTVILMWQPDAMNHNEIGVVVDKNRYGSPSKLKLTKQGYRGRLCSYEGERSAR